MLDKLFIDFIDIEWCFRAKRKKYSIVSFQDIELTIIWEFENKIFWKILSN